MNKIKSMLGEVSKLMLSNPVKCGHILIFHLIMKYQNFIQLMTCTCSVASVMSDTL